MASQVIGHRLQYSSMYPIMHLMYWIAARMLGCAVAYPSLALTRISKDKMFQILKKLAQFSGQMAVARDDPSHQTIITLLPNQDPMTLSTDQPLSYSDIETYM